VTEVPRPVSTVRALRVRPDRRVHLPEQVATEEPMQILVSGAGQAPEPLAVTMRTPGHDFELAAGFVLTEGVAGRSGIAGVDYCEAAAGAGPGRYNHVTVRLSSPWQPQARRWFAASSSCGMCGKATIADVETGCGLLPPGLPFPAELVASLPERLRRAQKGFDRTGGLHAAGLFAPDGALLCAREDIGRHNAVDKVAGWTVLSGCPPASAALAVSGRVSFEIVQKAAMAGVAVLAAVSAPSSLAVAAAERLGVALAAFVRDGRYNVYSHPERLDFA
jgi:FdhD protein